MLGKEQAELCAIESEAAQGKLTNLDGTKMEQQVKAVEDKLRSEMSAELESERNNNCFWKKNQKQRHKAEVKDQNAKLRRLSSYFINNHRETLGDTTNTTSSISNDDERVIDDTSMAAGPVYIDHGSEEHADSSDEILLPNKEHSDNLLPQNTPVPLPCFDAALWTVDALTQQYYVDMGPNF
ncbi:unnamed protein product [Caretta caretta]